MPSLYSQFVMAATLLADSASMFAGFAIIGFFTGHETSPLSWLVIFAILSVATIGVHLVQRIYPTGRVRLILYAIAGLFVSYGVAAGVAPVAVLPGRLAVPDAVGVYLAFLAACYLWCHAASMMTEREVERRLVSRLRFGTAWFVLAFIVEKGSGRDLQVEGLLLPFLVSALAALAINRFGGGLEASPFRLRLAVVMVLFVVAFGAAAGAVGDSVGRGLWPLVTAFFRSPLEAIRDGYLWTVDTAYDLVIGRESGRRSGTGEPSWWEGLGRFGQNDPNASVIPISHQGLAVLAIVAILGYLIYRFYLGPRDDPGGPRFVNRETIDDSIPFIGDTFRLIRGITSKGDGRFWPATPARSTGTEGQRETIELYRRLVTVACDRGHEFDDAETPNERAPDLKKVLPQASITKLTALVNATCFAGRDIDASTVQNLRRELQEALRSNGR